MTKDSGESLAFVLTTIRAPFAAVYDKYWRRERMLRYVYWLKNREQVSFNILGSWTEKDIATEINLWRYISNSCFSEEEVESCLDKIFDDRFDFDLVDALALAINPRLASMGLPIWNQRIGCLIPQRFGNCRIVKALDYAPKSSGENLGYAFQSDETSERFDLYLYLAPDGLELSKDDDQFLIQEIQKSWNEINQAAIEYHNAKIESGGKIKALDALNEESGAHVRLLAIDFVVINSQGVRCWSIVALSNMRGCFIKIRYTAPVEFILSVQGEAASKEWTSQLADFVGMYS